MESTCIPDGLVMLAGGVRSSAMQPILAPVVATLSYLASTVIQLGGEDLE